LSKAIPIQAASAFCHALTDAYAEGASIAGHEITRIEVARLDFPILRIQKDFERDQLLETLVEARDAIVLSQHLIIVFPLWHGTMPGIPPDARLPPKFHHERGR